MDFCRDDKVKKLIEKYGLESEMSDNVVAIKNNLVTMELSLDTMEFHEVTPNPKKENKNKKKSV